jgi:hypothetical protein
VNGTMNVVKIDAGGRISGQFSQQLKMQNLFCMFGDNRQMEKSAIFAKRLKPNTGKSY